MKRPDSELTPVDGNAVRLALLARQSLHGEAPRRDASSFARVGDKVSKLRRRKRARVSVAALALASVAALVLFIGHGRALTYRVVNGAVVDGLRIVAGPGTRVRFSDGSELALAVGAETHIASLDEHGGRVNLDDGTAEVTITKRPGAAWTLGAGPYSVRVTGTAFSLAWSARKQAFAIAMSRGSVVVSGPLVGTGITLRAGQRLQSSLTTGQLVVNDVNAETAEATPAAPVAPSATATEPAPTPVAPNPSAVSATAGLEASSPRPVGNEWRKKAAQGAFGEVIDAAERHGLDATLASASLEDLAALADSARYTRRLELAKRVLMAERARFPRSSTARDAAFFLGRIAEEEGGNASELYDRYLAESPQGSYAPQALGRKMMLAYHQHGAAAALPLARDYLERYPKGAYARSAATIAGETPVAPP